MSNNKPNLTKKEKEILSNLTEGQKAFFDKNFFKVSPRMWESDLKHYDETYSIDDSIVICECHNWGS